MRKLIISLSIVFFALSAFITFMALGIPSGDEGYQNKRGTEELNNVSPRSEEVLSQLGREQEANRTEVRELQATIASLENELSKKNEDILEKVEEKTSDRETRVLAVLGAGTFRSAQISINEDMLFDVERLVPDLKASPDSRIIIEGHTDNIPVSPTADTQFKDNMDLSFLRAKAVARIFTEQGIVPDRVSVIGYGDTRPIVSNETREGRAKNRRIEIKLVPEDKEL